MTISNKTLDAKGNQIVADGLTISYNSAAASAEFPVSPGHQPSVIAGIGDPNGVVTAKQGSLYLNVTGSGVANRMFVNTTGSTVWTGVSTAT